MTKKSEKFLTKIRKWRSDLEGDEADFRILRDHQRFTVKAMLVLPLYLIWMAGRLDGYPKLGALVFIVILVSFGLWRWQRIEECRSELEDDLMEKLAGDR